MVPPTVNWTLPHESVGKEMPSPTPDLGQSGGGKSSTEVPLSLVTLVCVKMTKSSPHSYALKLPGVL